MNMNFVRSAASLYLKCAIPVSFSSHFSEEAFHRFEFKRKFGERAPSGTREKFGRDCGFIQSPMQLGKRVAKDALIWPRVYFRSFRPYAFSFLSKREKDRLFRQWQELQVKEQMQAYPIVPKVNVASKKAKLLKLVA